MNCNVLPNFNCTIQELKRYIRPCYSKESGGFQLHHTGIKTENIAPSGAVQVDNFNCTIQELKRSWSWWRASERIYFNCTIQELKPAPFKRAYSPREYFNCTIQELKPRKKEGRMTNQEKFQLHHTGIKTGKAFSSYSFVDISIAPYRN